MVLAIDHSVYPDGEVTRVNIPQFCEVVLRSLKSSLSQEVYKWRVAIRGLSVMNTHLIGLGRHYVAVVALSPTIGDELGQRHAGECMREHAIRGKLGVVIHSP